MHVVLIHGMGRSPLSMMPLARHLRRQGHSTSLFGYSVATRSLPRIADAFVEHLSGVHAGDNGPYAIVGHSLGNIITRSLTGRMPAGLGRFIMLAPPNQPPALARAFGRHPVYRWLTGDAGQRLGDDGFYGDLPRPAVPTLIIAGNRSSGLLAYRGSAPNDGIVSVDETRLPGVPHRTVPAVHTLIMNHPAARTLTVRFLEQGTLTPVGQQAQE